MESDEKATGTRESILEHACQLLSEAGPDAFSSREVSRRVGISMGTLRYHYASKDELIDACLDTVDARVIALARQYQSHLTEMVPVDAIKFIIPTYLAYVRSNPSFLRLFESTLIRAGGLDERRRKNIQEPFLKELAVWFAGHFDCPIPELQLRIKTMILLISRYAITNDENIMSLTGLNTPEEARGAIDAHLIGVAIALLGGPEKAAQADKA